MKRVHIHIISLQLRVEIITTKNGDKKQRINVMKKDGNFLIKHKRMRSFGSCEELMVMKGVLRADYRVRRYP